jgi:hypothetical protein
MGLGVNSHRRWTFEPVAEMRSMARGTTSAATRLAKLEERLAVGYSLDALLEP